ncbi:MAG: type II toxin-antitoxin system VapC family toxin [Acidobacteriota bacterium]
MIYVDSNIFIFAFLSKDRKAQMSQSILIRIASNEISAFTSLLTWDEVVWSARKYLGVEDGLDQGEKFLEFPYLNLIEVQELVVKTAQDLMRRYDLKPRDALHAASALSRGLKEILSEDHDFDAVRELKRKSLEQFQG